MGTTYTEAQYSTPTARAMIRQMLGKLDPTKRDIECMVNYLCDTLRVGGRRAVRPIVMAAIEEGKNHV